MKLLKSALLAAALVAGGPAMADEAARAEAARLLEVMKMQPAIDSMADAMLDAQVKQNPDLAPYREVMLTFFRKYMGYESLKPDLVEIYSAEFTASELREISAFYSTPTGRKIMERMPMLVRKGAEMGAAHVQAHLDELKEAIQAEKLRLQGKDDAVRREADAAAQAAAETVKATEADDAGDAPVDKP
jgi:hypothetical protein